MCQICLTAASATTPSTLERCHTAHLTPGGNLTPNPYRGTSLIRKRSPLGPFRDNQQELPGVMLPVAFYPIAEYTGIS